ncbi:hypothetical protein [Acaryochloris marina]|uniref:hypothetical protein n=1 Tax=Acaryochloris marina TaxID=155978 RepID=UPI001BB09102|nr:hypothetical protein [Acaryochloris marina]QUY42927.1 hypothetical protein I1H34_01795 [Acaryochloris marina S15]
MPLDLHVNLVNFLIVMAVELGIGLLSGLIRKVLAKQQAHHHPECYQVVQCNDYKSVGYGIQTPDNSFNAFGMDYSFVIVEFKEREVIRERFFTSLGDSIKVEYTDGRLTARTSFLSAPIYTVTVVVPIVIGIVAVLGIAELGDDSSDNAYEVASIIGNYAIYFVASGLLWSTVLTAISSKMAMDNIGRRDSTSNTEGHISPQIQAIPISTEHQNSEPHGLGRYFWALLIAVTVVNGLTLYFQGWSDMATLDLKLSYAKLTLYILFWATVPWMVVGISCMRNQLSLNDYLEPPTLHPDLIAFFASLIGVFAMGSYWIFAAGGAEQLLHYPGLDIQAWSVEQVQQTWSLGVISGIVTMAVIVARTHRTSGD